MDRRLALVVFAVLVFVVLVLPTSPLSGPSVASAAEASYIPPVSPSIAVITDHFRAPVDRYAAGNRGLDYATVPGSPVVASAAGVVVFAGQVAGALHVTIAHPDGLRTSYSFLARLLVTTGARVRQGQPIGLTGPVFHFGVRDAAGDYLDPEALFAGRLGAHLVAGPDEGADPLGSGLAGEQRSLAAVVGAEIENVAGGSVRAIAHEVLALQPAVSAYRLAGELAEFQRAQRSRTPADQRLAKPARRRIAILVGGLGSSDRTASIDRLDTPALGYLRGDVIRFSYNGGRVADPAANHGVGASIAVTSYRASDTESDVRVTAARLADLVEQVARAAPGVPIDLVGHSEGGVVARLAVDEAADAGRLPSQLGLVVTIASPLQGTEAATALQAALGSPSGRRIAGVVATRAHLGLDPSGPALRQLSETSSIVDHLDRPTPAGVRFLSIGASGDLTVPFVRTTTPGTTSVLVGLGGLHAHDRLPSDPATTRAIALALVRRPPACVPVARGIAEVVTSHIIGQGEDALGLALAGAVR